MKIRAIFVFFGKFQSLVEIVNTIDNASIRCSIEIHISKRRLVLYYYYYEVLRIQKANSINGKFVKTVNIHLALRSIRLS